MTLLLAVLACHGVPDSQRYLTASRQTGDEAFATCSGIKATDARGECETYAADGLAKKGDGTHAQALCDKVDAPIWKEECWFLTGDDLNLVGDPAGSACTHAGRYRSNCLGHAIGREVATTEHRFAAPGREEQLTAAITEVVKRYKPNAPADQRSVTVHRVVAQILSKRWVGSSFDVDKCGKAPLDLCELGYRMNLDAAPPEIDLEGICKQGPTLALVQAARAPDWVPTSEGPALAVWKGLCDDFASGKVARDAAHSMGVPPNTPRTPPPQGVIPGDIDFGPSPVSAPTENPP